MDHTYPYPNVMHNAVTPPAQPLFERSSDSIDISAYINEAVAHNCSSVTFYALNSEDRRVPERPQKYEPIDSPPQISTPPTLETPPPAPAETPPPPASPIEIPLPPSRQETLQFSASSEEEQEYSESFEVEQQESNQSAAAYVNNIAPGPSPDNKDYVILYDANKTVLGRIRKEKCSFSTGTHLNVNPNPRPKPVPLAGLEKVLAELSGQSTESQSDSEGVQVKQEITESDIESDEGSSPQPGPSGSKTVLSDTESDTSEPSDQPREDLSSRASIEDTSFSSWSTNLEELQTAEKFILRHKDSTVSKKQSNI